MSPSRLALLIACVYTLITGLFTYYSGYLDDGNHALLSFLLLPVSLPIILGSMSGSVIAILIFLLISFLLQWLVFFVIIKVVSMFRSKIAR